MKFIALTQIDKAGNKRVIVFNRDFIKMIEPASDGRAWISMAADQGQRLVECDDIDRLRAQIEPQTG